MNQPRKKTLWATLAIVTIIVLAFCLTNVPSVQQAMAQVTNHPIYQSRADGISLVSIYEGEWEPLLSTCRQAADKQIPLTIALPAQTILTGQAQVVQLQQMGHEVALYGTDPDGAQQQDWIREQQQQIIQVQNVTQNKSLVYIPFSSHTSHAAALLCRQMGMKYALFSKDSRAFAASDATVLAQQIVENAQLGDFIYISLSPACDFAALAQNLCQRNLKCLTITQALAD